MVSVTVPPTRIPTTTTEQVTTMGTLVNVTTAQ